MKTGKVSESILKRSVLGKIKSNHETLVSGAGIGEDCAIFSFSENAQTAVCVNTVTGDLQDLGLYGIYAAINNIAAKGAVPDAVLVSVVLPEQAEEAQLRHMMEQIGDTARTLGIAVAGGHTEISAGVSLPILTVTGIGGYVADSPAKSEVEEAASDAKAAQTKQAVPGPAGRQAHPGQDVVITKWAGIAGTALIAKEKGQELLTKYPAHFIDAAKCFDQYLSILPEAALAVKSGVCTMHDASRGGLYAALWELAERSGVGLEIDLKRIPIRQETVEVCDFFDVNPYELIAGGSLIMTADNGYDLVRVMEQAHIPASVVGKVTGNNDRVVINEDERRFLEPSRTDGIYKVF